MQKGSTVFEALLQYLGLIFLKMESLSDDVIFQENEGLFPFFTFLVRLF